MDYNDYLTNRLKDYVLRQTDDDLIDPKEPFLELDWSKDHRSYFKRLIENKIVSRADVTRAIADAGRRHRIQEALGAYPADPVEYATLYLKRVAATVSYKGALTIPGRVNPTVIDLARGARLLAGEIGITFGRDAINDAVEELYSTRRDTALDAIRAAIEPRADFDWDRLAEGCFKPERRALTIAALKKTIWQVKRKMFGLPVTNHLMVVLFGAQGKGKSYFMQKLAEPIADLVSYSDFDAIGDDRNIDLWRSYLVIMDEMAKAAKADIEVTKHVITANVLERRPMRTNTTITVQQCASFIGGSNISLPELIKDETGNRRFFEAAWGEPAFGFLDTFDFCDAWRSISHLDPDPMLAYTDELATVQQQTRTTGPVETWLMTLIEDGYRAVWERADRNGFITSQA